MRDYGKLVWAVLGAVAFFLQGALQDGMSAEDWVGTVIAIANAGIVWMATDTTIAAQVKAWSGGVMAGLLVLQTVITGGLDSNDVLAIVVAVLTGAGVVADQRRPVHLAQKAA